jgi:DNA-binding MarR family transcriptional regulator
MGREPAPEELVRDCVAVGGLLRQAIAAALLPYGVTPEQHELLGLLASGLTTPGALVTASGRDKTTVSRAVARAAKAGFVAHARSEGDKRRQVLRVTDRGAAVLEQARRALERVSPKLMGELSPKERRRLAKILRKLKRGIAR